MALARLETLCGCRKTIHIDDHPPEVIDIPLRSYHIQPSEVNVESVLMKVRRFKLINWKRDYYGFIEAAYQEME